MQRSLIFERKIKAESELPAQEFLAGLKDCLLNSSGVAVGLIGDLGAGKTAFVRCLAKLLQIDAACITSPTYTLQHFYQVPQSAENRDTNLKLIEHWDVYRLGALPVELSERIPAGTLQVIEWADKFACPTDFSLHFSLQLDGTRCVSFYRNSFQ